MLSAHGLSLCLVYNENQMAGMDEFTQTFEVMEPGEGLFIVGGTFPGPNDRTEIKVDLSTLMPFMQVFHIGIGVRDRASIVAEYPERENPLGYREKATVGIDRGDSRFGFDPGEEWFRYGKRAARIGDAVVDLIIFDFETASFTLVTKPED